MWGILKTQSKWYSLSPKIYFDWNWALDLQRWTYINGKEGVIEGWRGLAKEGRELPRLVATVSSVASEAERVNRYTVFGRGWAVFGGWRWKVLWAIFVGKNPNNNLLLQQNLKGAENKQPSVNAMGDRHSCHLRRVIGKCWVRACSEFGGAALLC